MVPPPTKMTPRSHVTLEPPLAEFEIPQKAPLHLSDKWEISGDCGFPLAVPHVNVTSWLPKDTHP